MSERLPLAAGTRVGIFEIGAVASASGFGILYYASDSRLERPVLLKEYFPAELAIRIDGDAIAPMPGHDAMFRWGLTQWLGEARRLSRLTHPAVARIITYLEANDTAYTVLEAFDGVTLQTHLTELGRPLSEPEITRILRPLLDALQVMHAGNVIHRDVAADTIAVTRDGRSLFIDLFAACDVGTQHLEGEPAIVKHGTSPPEQYTSDRSFIGPWTDIYAVGALLSRLMTGRSPPSAHERMIEDQLAAIAAQTGQSYSAVLADSTAQCLMLLPKQRPQSIAMLRSMLAL